MLLIIYVGVKAAERNEESFDRQCSFPGGSGTENEIMRYNQLFALPIVAGLLTAASSLAMAATTGAAAVEPAKLGFAAAVTPAAAPSYVRLADDGFDPGDRDRDGDRDHGSRDRGDRNDNRPERSHR
jgi:hypothetical protein